jgi:beta-glucanase (GH16 family)
MRASRTAPATALVALVAVLAAMAPARPAAAEPAGWQPVFATDFADGVLPEQCRPYEGPHGGSTSDSFFRPDEVTVADGLLHLTMRPQVTAAGRYSVGGVGCDQLVQAYGRYEFRAKAPAGSGIDAYATLWPAAPADEERHATLVEVIPRPGNERLYLTNEYGAGATHVTVPGSYSAGFHTYTIEWSPTDLRILVDGQVRLADRRVSDAPKWIGFGLSSGDPLSGSPDRGTVLPADFQIDWLRVYAHDPGSATQPVPAPTNRPALAGNLGSSGSGGHAPFSVVAILLTVVCAVLISGANGYVQLRRRRRAVFRPAHRA